MIRLHSGGIIPGMSRDRKCFPRWRRQEYLILTGGWKQPDQRLGVGVDYRAGFIHEDQSGDFTVSWPSDDGEHILTPAEWNKRIFGGTENCDYTTAFTGNGEGWVRNDFRHGKDYEQDHKPLKLRGPLYKDPLRETWA